MVPLALRVDGLGLGLKVYGRPATRLGTKAKYLALSAKLSASPYLLGDGLARLGGLWSLDLGGGCLLPRWNHRGLGQALRLQGVQMALPLLQKWQVLTGSKSDRWSNIVEGRWIN